MANTNTSFTLGGALNGALNATTNAINSYVNTPAPSTQSKVTIPPASTSLTSNSTPMTSSSIPSTGTNAGLISMPKTTTPTASPSSYTGTSVVDYLNGQGKASDYTTRAGLAAQNGITNYTGSAAQNTQLLGLLNKPAVSQPATQQSSQQSSQPATQQQTQTYTPPQPAYTPPTQTSSNYTPAQTDIPSTYTPENTNLNAQAVADIANRSTQSGADYKAAQEEAKRISDQQTALAQDFAQKNQNISGTAGFLTQEAGLQGQLANKYNTVQGALANQYAGATNRLSAANTQQGLQQSALGTAISSSMPGMQFGQMTNQQTGAPVAGGTYMNNPMLNASVNNAVQIAMQSGPNSPAALALVNGLDQPGKLAYAQAMQQATGGNYNPTAMDSAAQDNVAIAKAFANTGTTINAAKQNIAGLSKQATDLIQQAGINTNDANWANEKINSYVTAQSNPVAYRSLQALNNEAQKFFSTIAGSGSNLIPTQVTDNIKNLDITDMSALKLNEFLQNIQAIGSAQANTAISQSQGASNTGATGFYTGGNQGNNTTLNPGYNNNANAASQLLVNGGIGLGSAVGGYSAATNMLPTAGSFISKVFGNIFK